MTTELLTCEELAQRLRLKSATVREWARTGQIPAIRVGPKVIRFDFAKVLSVLEAAPASSKEATNADY